MPVAILPLPKIASSRTLMMRIGLHGDLCVPNSSVALIDTPGSP